jgi:hypothetical protein
MVTQSKKAIKMKAMRSLETTQCIPENLHLQQHRWDNLELRKFTQAINDLAYSEKA